jgi:hypothetical protein
MRPFPACGHVSGDTKCFQIPLPRLFRVLLACHVRQMHQQFYPVLWRKLGSHGMRKPEHTLDKRIDFSVFIFLRSSRFPCSTYRDDLGKRTVTAE